MENINFFEKYYDTLPGIKSIITIDKDYFDVTPEFFLENESIKNKLQIVFIKTTMGEKNNIDEIVFIVRDEIHIHQKKEIDGYKMTMLINPSQINEIKYFINALKKIKK
jgi:hypothetical protein